ncbi:MAG: VWA domain-containing protein [Kiritimatiellia bacterium]
MRYKLLPDIEESGYADVESLNRRLQRHRFFIGLFAAILSVTFHLFIAWRLPDFVLPRNFESLRKPEARHFRVTEVTPASRAVQPTRPQKATADKPGPGFNVRADAIALKRAVDEVKLAPQPLPSGALERAPSAPPVPAARETPWSPREEILKVEERLAKEEIPELPRRLIPQLDRIKGAADVTLPVEAPRTKVSSSDAITLSEAARQNIAQARPPTVGPADTQWDRLEDLLKPVPGPVLGAGGAEAGGPAAVASVATIEPLDREALTPVESMLKAELKTHVDRSDPGYVYARIDITRAGAGAIPVLPKDVLFIQDASGSITEQRLAFCRQGLLRCLARLSPRDRFNVVSFRDAPERCFPDWAPATPANLETGRNFVDALESRGNTDIYRSLRELLAMDRKPVRPVVVIIISDGLPTAGMRDSAEIISAFTRENAGAVSVFAMATYDQANLYLLDMLSYMNRGDSVAARRGRWSIADILESHFEGVCRPVLSDMYFRFSTTGAEMVPALTPNLYLDRALVLYGRLPRTADRLVFQVVGRSGAAGCDMVFDLKMAEAAKGDATIREEWAWHKVYGLIGEHTRTRDPALVKAIQSVASQYDLKVPYAEELK